MPVEVGMDLQESAATDLVETAPDEIRIGDQSPDPSQRAQEIDEWLGIEIMDKPAGDGTKPGFTRGCKLHLVGVFEADIPLSPKLGKLGRYPRNQSGIKKIVQADMRVRPGSGIRSMQILTRISAWTIFLMPDW